MRSKSTLRATAIAALASTSLLATPNAGAAILAQVVLVPDKASYVVDEKISIGVYLRNITDSNTASPAQVIAIDIDFGGISNTSTPLKFVAATGAPKAFLAGSAFSGTMAPFGSGSPADGGSLVEGYSPSFADLSFGLANGAINGFIANGSDVFIGTIYASAAGTGRYTVSAQHGNTLVQSDNANFDPFTLSYMDAGFNVSPIPEPSVGALALLGVAALYRKRSRLCL